MGYPQAPGIVGDDPGRERFPTGKGRQTEVSELPGTTLPVGSDARMPIVAFTAEYFKTQQVCTIERTGPYGTEPLQE
jgi:hypothetical protein